MATKIQSVPGSGNYVNSYSLTATTFTAGNTLLIRLASGASDTMTITDDKGDTFVQDSDEILVSQRQGQIVRASNITGGLTTITVTAGAGTYPNSAILVEEWSGIATSPFDKSVVNTAASSTTFASGSTGTTTQVNELAYGIVAVDSATNDFTGDATWTGGVGAPGGDAYTGLYGQYKILSSVGTVSWTTTSATAHNGSIAVVTYKLSGAAPVGHNFLPFFT
jgi:hypothetical protein